MSSSHTVLNLSDGVSNPLVPPYSELKRENIEAVALLVNQWLSDRVKNDPDFKFFNDHSNYRKNVGAGLVEIFGATHSFTFPDDKGAFTNQIQIYILPKCLEFALKEMVELKQSHEDAENDKKRIGELQEHITFLEREMNAQAEKDKAEIDRLRASLQAKEEVICELRAIIARSVTTALEARVEALEARDVNAFDF